MKIKFFMSQEVAINKIETEYKKSCNLPMSYDKNNHRFKNKTSFIDLVLGVAYVSGSVVFRRIGNKNVITSELYGFKNELEQVKEVLAFLGVKIHAEVKAPYGLDRIPDAIFELNYKIEAINLNKREDIRSLQDEVKLLKKVLGLYVKQDETDNKKTEIIGRLKEKMRIQKLEIAYKQLLKNEKMREVSN